MPIQRIAYFVPEFPSQTHAFFWRELKELRRTKHVEIVSTRRPKVDCPHNFAAQAKSETTYISDFVFRDLAASTVLILSCIKNAAAAHRLTKADGSSDSLVKLILLSFLGAVLNRRLKRMRIDHVHGHSCANTAYLLAFSRLLGGPPYSVTLHGDLSVYGCGHIFKFQNAEFVACVTEALLTQVSTRFGSQVTQLRLIRMGIDIDDLPNAKINYEIKGNATQLITVARLNPTKGHIHALRACSALLKEGYDIRYTIVGDGQTKDYLLDAAQQLGLSENVRFLGSISSDGVNTELLDSDIFLLPSFGLGEAAPVAIMEAMGLGIPVVSTIIGGTPELIDNGVTGLLVPQCDDAAMARAISMLICDGDLRRKLGLAGLRHAKANFSAKSAANLLLDAIEQNG